MAKRSLDSRPFLTSGNRDPRNSSATSAHDNRSAIDVQCRDLAPRCSTSRRAGKKGREEGRNQIRRTGAIYIVTLSSINTVVMETYLMRI